MAEIINFGNQETLVDFIRREGPVTTWAVSTRFGWDMLTTRRKLKDLQETGAIQSVRSHWNGDGSILLNWFVPK